MLIKFLIPLLSVAVCFFALKKARATGNVFGTVRYVVDGDSLYISGHKPQIRLWGVDAPEKDKDGFQAATTALKRISLGKRVKCNIVTKDKYGRSVARCYLRGGKGKEINRLMIDSGTAKEYRWFSKGYYSRKH